MIIKLLTFTVALIVTSVLNLSLSAPAKAAACDSSVTRWASSSNTIYITGPVTCTLTEIKAARPNIPLNQVDTANKIWVLGANLKLEQGATLKLYGAAAGGDVNQLRLKSNNSSNAGSIIWVRGDWGKIDISNTKITSWNESANSPDTEYATYKRSYIHVRSSLDGSIPRESRMDITNSDIGYLGFNGAEAYGLSWKVLGNTPGIYDTVNVYGNVTGSRIHHNYFGAYTYGAEAMQWSSNEIDSNISYGLDTHDDSDNLIVAGNKFHDNGNHGFICSQRCNNITVQNNQAYKNKGNGIMLHRNTNNSLVENNQVTDNADSGIALFESHNNIIRGNASLRNKNGIRFSVGSSNNTVENNEFGNNITYGLYFYKGSDIPISGDGRPKNNRFFSNNIHDNGNYMAKIKEADGNTFQNNTFQNNGRELYLYDANNNVFTGNTLSGNKSNFYYARLNANNTILDTGQMSVKIGDSLSKMGIESSQNFIFNNNKGIPTVAKPNGSQALLARLISESVVSFNQLNFTVKPNSNEVTVIPQIWETSGGFYKKWSEQSDTAASAEHMVGDLKPNTTYTILVDNSPWKNLTSNVSGQITFNYDSGDLGTKVFEVKETTGQESPIVTQQEPEASSSPTISPPPSPTKVEPNPTSTPTEPEPEQTALEPTPSLQPESALSGSTPVSGEEEQSSHNDQDKD